MFKTEQELVAAYYKPRVSNPDLGDDPITVARAAAEFVNKFNWFCGPKVIIPQAIIVEGQALDVKVTKQGEKVLCLAFAPGTCTYDVTKLMLSD